MIFIKDLFIETLEQIDIVIDEASNYIYKEGQEDIFRIFREYLIDCHYADVKLQEMVTNRFGDDYVSFVILPIEEIDDWGSYSFSLVSMSGKKIKKRDELIYSEFCDLCFQFIRPFSYRLNDFFTEKS